MKKVTSQRLLPYLITRPFANSELHKWVWRVGTGRTGVGCKIYRPNNLETQAQDLVQLKTQAV